MKFKSKIPKNIDPIALADRMKKGLTKRFLREIDELRKIRAHLAKGS